MHIYKAGGCLPKTPVVRSWEELGVTQLRDLSQRQRFRLPEVPFSASLRGSLVLSTGEGKGHRLLECQSWGTFWRNLPLHR